MRDSCPACWRPVCELPREMARPAPERKTESHRDDGNYARTDQPHRADQQGRPLPAAARHGPKPAVQKIDVVPHPTDGKTKHQDLQWMEFTTAEGLCKHADDEQASDDCRASERSLGSSAWQWLIRMRLPRPCPVSHEQRPAMEGLVNRRRRPGWIAGTRSASG